MTDRELLEYAASLVDDLCLLQLGHCDDNELEIYYKARDRVLVRGVQVRKLKQIENLKSQIAVLEGKT